MARIVTSSVDLEHLAPHLSDLAAQAPALGLHFAPQCGKNCIASLAIGLQDLLMNSSHLAARALVPGLLPK